MLKNKIAILFSFLIFTSLSANENYEININSQYIKLKPLDSKNFEQDYSTKTDRKDRVLPCNYIPKNYEAGKFFANLKDYQIVVCGDFIYRADTKNWYIKK